ncbi:class I SAM-dependent methyltransferase, partial [Gemmatimonadota bacterium]
MSFRLTPSILLTVLQPWTEVVEPIYKRVAQMVDANDWGETLWVGCGSGRSVLWWAQKFQSITQGLDPDPEAVESAEARVRGTNL